MERRMRGVLALICYTVAFNNIYGFIPGADGPVSSQEALEGGNTTLYCDSSTSTSDQLMLLVWYKNNAPIYSYDARSFLEWSSPVFNISSRLQIDRFHQPTALTISSLRDEDQALYHCRVDFLVEPTRNIGVNLTVVVLPSQPFFLDELGNKVEDKIGPYHEGDTLVLSCLVIGGRPPPHISWYSGDTLVDASDGVSDIPGVKENELYLPLSRDNAASLSCRATNTQLTAPIVATLKVELYLAPYNVSIHYVRGTRDGSVVAGRPAGVRCVAIGCVPAPDLAWWLGHNHLTSKSNQSWISSTNTATSYLELTPSVGDNGATLACVATNPVMAPSRGSKADVITLNVTYSPIVEVSRIGAGGAGEVVELDPLHLECEVRANPPTTRFSWYFNDVQIISGDIWGSKTTSAVLRVEESSRRHAGKYSCAATNNVGETRSEAVSITIYYPPECTEIGITLKKETIYCNVIALPPPDTFFWHIEPHGLETQDLTTGSALLPLSQITGPLTGPIKISCEAGNGVSSQEKKCMRTISLEHLRPQTPQQCDIAYEYGEFQMRCVPVENATYYEVSVWRMSESNTSLILENRGTMGIGTSQALATRPESPWLLRGRLGVLVAGEEAGVRACSRFGCSRVRLLRPADLLLRAAAPPWWHALLEKDVGISIGAVVLVLVFIISTFLAIRLARRTRSKPPAPVIQVLQLDDVAREYLDAIGEQKYRASCSIRSCSSVYSDNSNEWSPPVDRIRKPKPLLDPPPPDVTLTLHRESAV